MKIKIDKKRIILKTAIYVCAALVLAAAYRSGGGLLGNDRAAEELPKPAESLVKVENEEIRQMPKNADTAAKSEGAAENKPTSEEGGQQKSDSIKTAENSGSAADSKTGGQSAAAGKGSDTAANGGTEDGAYTCTISIKCGTALSSAALKKEKAAILPSDGVILETTKAEFRDGESVFDVLQRETKSKKIHMEFSNTPGIGSAYIEGIGNLYEHDCGELSGWMYRVNGEFPKYSCSEYKLKKGDKVEWLYTCDLGADIGGSNLK